MTNEPLRKYFIGANGTGKTYRLKQIQKNDPEVVLFFDENGLINSMSLVKRVQIVDNIYEYIDDSSRGISDDKRRNSLTNKINSNLLEPLAVVEEINQKLKRVRKSPGIIKLLTITEELLSTNLNKIETIIIDEPENLLDDENLKILISIVNSFSEIGVNTVYVTHSSRFLELSMAKIEEIFVLENSIRNQNIYNISFEKIINLFEQTSQDILNINGFLDEGNHNNNIVGKLKLRSKGLELFLKTILSSSEFYRCLFYSGVILAEGLTERLLISSRPAEKMKNKNFYFTNGKVYMPFFIELFRSYGLKVRVVFDSDVNEDTPTLASYLTIFMKERYDSNDVILVSSQNKDIEADYNIDNETRTRVKEDSEISRNHVKLNYYKPYIALYAFNENKDYYDKFIDSIFAAEEKQDFNFT